MPRPDISDHDGLLLGYLVTRLSLSTIVRTPTSTYLIVPSEMTASSLSERIAFSPQPLHSNGFFSCRGRTLVITLIACSVTLRVVTSLRSFTAWHFSGLWYRPDQIQPIDLDWRRLDLPAQRSGLWRRPDLWQSRLTDVVNLCIARIDLDWRRLYLPAHRSGPLAQARSMIIEIDWRRQSLHCAHIKDTYRHLPSQSMPPTQ